MTYLARRIRAAALPGCQQLLTLLIRDPALSYAEISARLGIPVLGFLLAGGIQIFLAGLGVFSFRDQDAAAGGSAFDAHQTLGFTMGGIAVVILIAALIARPGVLPTCLAGVLVLQTCLVQSLLASLADNTALYGGLHALPWTGCSRWASPASCTRRPGDGRLEGRRAARDRCPAGRIRGSRPGRAAGSPDERRGGRGGRPGRGGRCGPDLSRQGRLQGQQPGLQPGRPGRGGGLRHARRSGRPPRGKPHRQQIKWLALTAGAFLASLLLAVLTTWDGPPGLNTVANTVSAVVPLFGIPAAKAGFWPSSAPGSRPAPA